MFPLTFTSKRPEADELAALPYVIFKRLKEHNVFEACDFKFLFIGELRVPQMKDAYPKAFAEANSDAKACNVIWALLGETCSYDT
ncbi:MAG: hypothetical protein U0905_17220 [Pirellulales bacterium]